jgi:hypothetical protein
MRRIARAPWRTNSVSGNVLPRTKGSTAAFSQIIEKLAPAAQGR